MTRPIQFQLDEHIDNAVARALRRRGIGAFTISEAGFRGRRDADILAMSNIEQRVVVTFDDDYLRLHYRGDPHQGIVFFGSISSQSLSNVVFCLTLIHEALDAEVMVGKLEFF